MVMTKKPRPRRGFLWFQSWDLGQDSLNRSSLNDADILAFLGAFDMKDHLSVGRCVQGVILAATDVVSRMEAGAALPHDDAASLNQLTAEALHAESLGF
jgi:hypothetical protein